MSLRDELQRLITVRSKCRQQHWPVEHKFDQPFEKYLPPFEQYQWLESSRSTIVCIGEFLACGENNWKGLADLVEELYEIDWKDLWLSMQKEYDQIMLDFQGFADSDDYEELWGLVRHNYNSVQDLCDSLKGFHDIVEVYAAVQRTLAQHTGKLDELWYLTNRTFLQA